MNYEVFIDRVPTVSRRLEEASREGDNYELRIRRTRYFLTRLSVVFTFFILHSSFFILSAQNLVPRPVSTEWNGERVVLASYPNVEAVQSELEPLAHYLSEYLPAGRVILSRYETTTLPAEGYRLKVAPEGIFIAGADYGGVWNGIQTLLQLFPAKIYSKSELPEIVRLPAVTIEDWPRMAHRGVMLDVARAFVPKEEVMRLIDNLSRHKINKFHWHLADDEGWRIEIKSVPRLTSVGAFRGGDSPVFPVYGAWNERHGGFYTHDEIREVVAYAALRNVEVIPEIDLPGHSRAAAIAYPEILCNYKPDLDVSAGYDIRNVWCAAHEENYAMLDSIVREVAALFPSPTLHLGGDEVLTGQWSRCPDCKALMAARGIGDVARLQDIFMARVIDIAARHGKKAAVWNEAAGSGEIPRSTTVWGWENIPAARRAAAAGYPTVVCAGSYFYFDMKQSPDAVGHVWAGIVPIEKVYGFDPARVGFTEAEAANVAGIEATLFGELMLENGPGYIDYQLFPRVCALAEAAWTQADRSWDDFYGRLNAKHFARMDAMGIAYYGSGIPTTSPSTSSSVLLLPEGGENAMADRPLKTPAVTFTSSMAENANYPFSGVSSYKAAARVSRAPIEGDWFMWTFAAPVTASRVDIRTGYGHLQRAGFPQGRVEVSYDGKAFEPVAGFHDLKATFAPSQPLRALRIICESHGNGENFTIIQPLKIR